MTSLLVTGITGNVGTELCRILVRTRPAAHVRVLIRARDHAELQARWAKALEAAAGGGVTPADLRGFVPVMGDVTAPGLGLAPEARDAILGETTHIIHSASLTSFAAPMSLLEPINVAGLERVLAIARSCRSLQAFAHLSTCFTAGRRRGPVLESELEHDCGFTNSYEESKYCGEQIARKAMAELPLSVFRLSLLVGRKDGYVHNPGAFHFFLEKLYAGLLPLIPGHPEAYFDLLPTDYAAEVVAALVFDHFEVGKTYHVAAGDRAPRTQDWLRLTTDVFKSTAAPWKAGAHVTPEIVDLETYRHLVDTVHTVGNKTLARMLKVIDSVAEYPQSTKVFDRGNVVTALGATMPVPPFESYYPAIVERTMRNAQPQ